MNSLTFALPGAAWSLELDPKAITTLLSAAQTRAASPERLGQLFSRDLQASKVVVSLATEVKALQARRAKVVFDTTDMSAQRAALFAQGWHFVGIWHTHPERCPEPSYTDVLLAQDHARAASEFLTALIFVIVGNRGRPSIRCWAQESSGSEGGSLLAMEVGRSLDLREQRIASDDQ